MPAPIHKHERLQESLALAKQRVTDLEADILALIDDRERLWSEIAELNLRVLYAMQMVQFRKTIPSGMLDANGQPIADVVSSTLYDFYLREREAFQAKVATSVEEATRHRASPQPSPSGQPSPLIPPDVDRAIEQNQAAQRAHDERVAHASRAGLAVVDRRDTEPPIA